MKFKNRTLGLALATSALILAGCAKKPAPKAQVEPVPPKVEMPKTVAPVTPTEDKDALRRQRIQAQIAETFRPIYFEYDQSTLNAEGKATCEAVGQLMKEVSEITARIEGHADERGTNEYNLALGERRAKTIQDYLSSYGVPVSRLSVISYGEEKPAMEGHDEASFAKNRRVEFTSTF